MNRRRLLAAASLAVLTHPAAAQPAREAERFPARPVRIVVPNAAGAALDAVGRLLVQKLSETADASFIVENMPGAGGTIGIGRAARSAPDGYTLLLINQDFIIQPLVKAKVPYDPFKDFVPLASIATAPEAISVHPSLPAKSMQELIALIRSNPGKYSYATPGIGTSPHVASERLFRLSNGLDIVHVPFQGGAPAVQSTLAGDTQVIHINLTLVADHARQGKLRVLAVADAQRALQAPDVPTLSEAGIPNHDVGFWIGMVAPTGTPRSAVEFLQGQLAKAIADPAFTARLTALGFRPLTGAADELGGILKRETAEWSRVVTEAKISID
jgi:tripartite-type tricarboxylate transporter receptor subunit TctC